MQTNHRHIVLVDDDPINNLICRKKLHKARTDLTIVEYVVARKGLEYFQQNPTTDLLLLDINMPDLDAWTFLDEMEKIGVRVPVIIITSSIDQDDLEKAKNYDVIIDYVIKPMTEDKINKIVSHIK